MSYIWWSWLGLFKKLLVAEWAPDISGDSNTTYESSEAWNSKLCVWCNTYMREDDENENSNIGRDYIYWKKLYP